MIDPSQPSGPAVGPRLQHDDRRLGRPQGPFELAALRPELRAWETTYNTIRPHQALGYLTPAEYLASIGVDV